MDERRMTVGIIPRWGRTSRYALELLGDLSGHRPDDVIGIIESSRSHSSQNPAEADAYLQTLRGQGHSCFSLYPDRNRAGHPDRVGLRSLELVINGVDVRIEGDEPHNASTAIRLDQADFAFTGLDELLIHNQQWMLDKGIHVRSWGNHNYQLESPTDVLVAGSAGLMYTPKGGKQRLQDFIGLFLIGNPARRPVENTRPDVFNGTVPIFVDGRYEGIVLNRHPAAKTVVVENVEDAVAATPGSYGFELVQTGGSAARKNLVVYGAPLVLSETLLVVNYGHFKRSPELQEVVHALSPQGFYDEKRVNNFVDWYVVLESTLGKNWANKPFIEDVFVTDREIAAGVRPYNTRSHGWKASDTLPHQERFSQISHIEEMRHKLVMKYAEHWVRSYAEQFPDDRVIAGGMAPEVTLFAAYALRAAAREQGTLLGA